MYRQAAELPVCSAAGLHARCWRKICVGLYVSPQRLLLHHPHLHPPPQGFSFTSTQQQVHSGSKDGRQLGERLLLLCREHKTDCIHTVSIIRTVQSNERLSVSLLIVFVSHFNCQETTSHCDCDTCSDSVSSSNFLSTPRVGNVSCRVVYVTSDARVHLV